VGVPLGPIITAMENGAVNIGALITSRRPLEQVKEAFKSVADRTEIGVVITA
jgi:Zn-dependent alcohol dehydrogenase